MLSQINLGIVSSQPGKHENKWTPLPVLPAGQSVVNTANKSDQWVVNAYSHACNLQIRSMNSECIQPCRQPTNQINEWWIHTAMHTTYKEYQSKYWKHIYNADQRIPNTNLQSKCINTEYRFVEVLLYVHRNRRFIRDGSPGCPPRLSLSSWALRIQTHNWRPINAEYSLQCNTSVCIQEHAWRNDRHRFCLLPDQCFILCLFMAGWY